MKNLISILFFALGFSAMAQFSPIQHNPFTTNTPANTTAQWANVNSPVYSVVQAGGVTYPNLDMAMWAGITNNVPVTMSAGTFVITNSYICTVPVSGQGDSTIVLITNYPTSQSPNDYPPIFNWSTNGSVFSDFQIVCATPSNAYVLPFGLGTNQAVVTGAKATLKNISCHLAPTDVAYISPNCNGSSATFINCDFSGNRWDIFNTYSTNGNYYFKNCILTANGPNYVSGGTDVSQGTVINGGYNSFFYQDCVIGASNTNSVAIKQNTLIAAVRGALNITLENCVVTNLTTSQTTPATNLIVLAATGATEFRNLTIIGGDVNPIGISYTGNLLRKNYKSTPMVQYYTNYLTAASSGALHATQGTFLMSSGSTTYTLTDYVATTNSMVLASFGTPTITATTISGVASAGSILFTANVALTANAVVNWQIINPLQ